MARLGPEERRIYDEAAVLTELALGVPAYAAAFAAGQALPGEAAIAEALAALPVEQRAALVLVDMEGYSVAEVAQMLDCAPGTVKSRCSRGRSRLASMLAALRPADQRDSAHPDPRNPPPEPGVQPLQPRGPPAVG